MRRGGKRQRIAQRLSSALGGAPAAPLRALRSFRPELASGSQPHVLAWRTVRPPQARRPGNPASNPASSPAPDPASSRGDRCGATAAGAPGAVARPGAQAVMRGGGAGAAVYTGAFAPEEVGGTDSPAAVPAECLKAGEGRASGTAAGGTAAGEAAALPGPGKRPAPQVGSLSRTAFSAAACLLRLCHLSHYCGQRCKACWALSACVKPFERLLAPKVTSRP